jgi:hypothetical protein
MTTTVTIASLALQTESWELPAGATLEAVWPDMDRNGDSCLKVAFTLKERTPAKPAKKAPAKRKPKA